MPHSTRSSSASAPCRLELRASLLLVAALALLAASAAFAVLASEMPRAAAWPLAVTALAHGTWLALREARRGTRELVIDGEGRGSVDGRPVAGLRVRWRGPIAFVHWRDGDGRRRHVFFPDTLPAPRRRELRLAAPVPAPARQAPSVAP